MSEIIFLILLLLCLLFCGSKFGSFYQWKMIMTVNDRLICIWRRWLLNSSQVISHLPSPTDPPPFPFSTGFSPLSPKLAPSQTRVKVISISSTGGELLILWFNVHLPTLLDAWHWTNPFWACHTHEFIIKE